MVHGEEQEQEQEQVCSEDDQTCHAKYDQAEAIPVDDYVDDDDGDNADDDDFTDDDFTDDDFTDDVNVDANADVDDDDDDDDFEDDDDDDDGCNDNHPQCQEWSEVGECDKNPGYMLAQCRLSCNVCQS